MHKIVFTTPFFHACGAPPLCLISCYTTCYKAGMVGPVQPTSSRMTSHHFSASFPVAKNKEKNRETVLKKMEGVVELIGCCLSLPSIPWWSRVGLR
jgi:hypothetical protein